MSHNNCIDVLNDAMMRIDLHSLDCCGKVVCVSEEEERGKAK